MQRAREQKVGERRKRRVENMPFFQPERRFVYEEIGDPRSGRDDVRQQIWKRPRTVASVRKRREKGAIDEARHCDRNGENIFEQIYPSTPRGIGAPSEREEDQNGEQGKAQPKIGLRREVEQSFTPMGISVVARGKKAQ